MKNNTYILLINIPRNLKISVGKLGEVNFKKGFYLYIGSEKRNMEKRIERHLRKKKKKFWHIDYLLSHKLVKIEKIWVTQKYRECEIADFLFSGGLDFIKRFGSSDCRCKSHLFYTGEKPTKINFLNLYPYSEVISRGLKGI